MRVLVVYANCYRMLAPLPLGASLVADRLRRAGHEVRLLDLLFARSAAEATFRATAEFRPDLVGLSLRNVDTQSRTDPREFLDDYRAIALAARHAAPAATLLLGGTAFTTFPRQYLRELGADYGLAGDDLEPIARYVASLAAGAPDLSVPGLVYREEDEVRANPFAIVGYADTVFGGYDLVDLQPYRREPLSLWDVGVVTRTGCPFECVYCDTYRTFGRRWVLRPPRQVAAEVAALARRGARSVFFADAGFNRPLDHAKAILEEVIRARPGVALSGIFEPGEMDTEFAALFKRAGGSDLMIFAGSLADRVLAAQRKPFATAEVFAGARLLADAGVSLSLALSLGGPGETPQTIAETLAQAPRLGAVFTWLEGGYRIQPDTALHRLALAEGVVRPGDDLFHPRFYFSPATPAALVDGRVEEFNHQQPPRLRQSLAWSLTYLKQKAAAWLPLV